MRSSFAAARRYCSATERFGDSKLWAETVCDAANNITNASSHRWDFDNEIRDLADAAKGACIKAILGMGCRAR